MLLHEFVCTQCSERGVAYQGYGGWRPPGSWIWALTDRKALEDLTEERYSSLNIFCSWACVLEYAEGKVDEEKGTDTRLVTCAVCGKVDKAVSVGGLPWVSGEDWVALYGDGGWEDLCGSECVAEFRRRNAVVYENTEAGQIAKGMRMCTTTTGEVRHG